MSSRFDIDRTNHVCVFRKAALDALKFILRLTIFRTDMLTSWSGLAGVVCWHSQHTTASETLLISQLSPEFVPALVENRPIQTTLGGDVGARIFRCTSG